MAGRAVDAAGKLEGYEIFIKYLPVDTQAKPLREYFAPAGQIVGEPRLMMHPQTGKCKGVGWITFATQAGLAEALRWDGCNYGGRHLNITAAKAQHAGIRPSLQEPGTHTPAMLRECVSKLVGSDANGTFVDGTFGRGGHARGILAALGPNGRLHAFDMDPEAIAAGKELARTDSRFAIHHAPFSSMVSVLRPILERAPSGGRELRGVFLDLGISSPQFDEAHRGFRPEADGPLDLRFDNTKGPTAWEFLQSAERGEIVRVLHEYGETADPIAARRIADAVCVARATGTLPKRTKEFAALVADAKGKEYQPMHAAKLAFQALRIHLNDEFGEMRRGMHAAGELLAEGGRIGLITWKHSECAIVVDVARKLEALRPESPLVRWYREQQRKEEQKKGSSGSLPALPSSGWALVMDDATRPGEAELQTNSRSRSAVLHVLRKVHAPQMAHLEAIAYKRLGWSSNPEDQRNGKAAQERDLLPTSPATDGDASATKLSKAERKAKRLARKSGATSDGVDATVDEEQARKDAIARQNRAQKKELKKRRRDETA